MMAARAHTHARRPLPEDVSTRLRCAVWAQPHLTRTRAFMRWHTRAQVALSESPPLALGYMYVYKRKDAQEVQ